MSLKGRILGLALVLVLFFRLFLSVAEAQRKVIVRIASAFEPGHILVNAAEKFKELVEKRSGGEIEVQLFPGGVMGSEEKVTEAVAVGGVEMQTGGGLPIKTFAPQYYFFDTPYILKDFDHYLRTWEGPLGQKCKELLEKKGNTIHLGVVYRGLRMFTSNKPIYTPDDVKGLKLRLPMIPAWVAIWKEIGALPVPIALPELFTSLKLGVADASEGDITQIWAFKLHEVQKYLGLTNHHVQTGGLSINKPFFDRLDKRYQEIIVQAAKEATSWASKELVRNEAKYIIDLQRKGMTVVYPDADAFREKAKPAVEKLFKAEFPVTTWEEVLSY